MKSFIQTIAIVAALSVPAISFAQSDQSLTRAEVKAQLIQLERAGYHPAGDRTHYPDAIEAAQARVNVENGASTDVGGVADGVSSSGNSYRAPAHTGEQPVYVGH